MSKLLFINACTNRKTSRTLRLARKVAEKFPGYEKEELVLEELDLHPLTSDMLSRRNELARSGDFTDPIFDYAKKFASADVIIVATPFWEDCFNSYTKIFMEYAAAIGIVFRYSEDGREIGMCRAKCLYYVTTRGGDISDAEDLGYMVYRSLAKTYGIGRTSIISASGLDIVGNDAEGILKEAMSSVPSKL